MKTWLIVVLLLAFVLFTKSGQQLVSGLGFRLSPGSAQGSVGMPRGTTPPPNPYATQQQVQAWAGVVNQGAGALNSLGGAIKNAIGGGSYGPNAPPQTSDSLGMPDFSGGSYTTDYGTNFGDV